MSTGRFSDAEVIALHTRVKELGEELQVVLDELLRRVAVAYEGDDDVGAIEALAQIQSIRDDHNGTGGGGASDPRPAEPGVRGNILSAEAGGS